MRKGRKKRWKREGEGEGKRGRESVKETEKEKEEEEKMEKAVLKSSSLSTPPSLDAFPSTIPSSDGARE